MRFECKQNALCLYIEDNKSGLTYIATNYNDMKDLVTLLNKQSQQLADKDKEIERQDKTIREINKSKYDKLMEKDILFHLKNRNEELEAKLAESEDKIMVTNYLRKNSDEVLLNYKTEKYGLDKTIQELRKMNLSLPEKEWYYKGFENCERQMSSHIADLTLEVKELRRQLALTENAGDDENE